MEKNVFMEKLMYKKGRIIYNLNGVNIFSVDEKDIPNKDLSANEFFKIVECKNITKKMYISTLQY
jgi:hypothetical protein